MATAVRVTTSAGEVRAKDAPARLALVGTGAFGHRVTSFLAEAHPGSAEAEPGDLTPAFTGGGAAAVVVAAPRLRAALCERADELAYRYGVPWLPVIAEYPVLRIGPLVLPPGGPCFACYRARRRQHDTGYRDSELADAAAETGSAPEQSGYLPQHARLAAAVATRLLGDRRPGLVYSIDLHSGRGGAYPVIARHDCRREEHPRGPAALDLARIATRLSPARTAAQA